MSGQPNQTPLDADKFRQAYMSNLNLRIALDDKNLQANKTYNRTGQLPVEPSDFRTTAEKLADVLTLRKEVRSQLGKIADGTNANKISVELTPAELVFYYQQSGIVNKLINERYSKGVIADIFIPFLQKYMADTIANKGVSSGLQQSSGPNLLLSGENIARGLASQPDYIGLLESYYDTGIDIRDSIREAIEILPPINLFQMINSVDDENERFTLLEEANNYLKDLPSKSEISSKIREVQRLKNIRSSSGKTDLLSAETERVIQLITPSRDTQIQKQNILQAIDRADVIEPLRAEELSATPIGRAQDIFSRAFGKELSPKKLPYPPISVPFLVKQIDTAGNLSIIDNLNRDEIFGIIQHLDRSVLQNKNDNDKPFYMTGINGVIGVPVAKFKELGLKKRQDLILGLSPEKKALFMKAIKNAVEYDKTQISDVAQDMFDPFEGKGMKNNLYMTGNGIAVNYKTKRYDAIKSTDIDKSMGFEKTPRYIPFGRYFINKNRLNDSVVSIRRPSGGSIVEFPSVKISSNLSNVLKKIVGRGVPVFEDLEALTDEEKAYLHKLAKESQIIDRLSIPAPKKDDIDKDLNRFEILKGQITSGNDNKELIKEFKMLIMKLTNIKIIPKIQARDILFDLTSMGF